MFGKLGITVLVTVIVSVELQEIVSVIFERRGTFYLTCRVCWGPHVVAVTPATLLNTVDTGI